MDLRLGNLNGCGLRSDSTISQLLLNLQCRGIDICCLQETNFDSNLREGILTRDYLSFSAFLTVVLGVTWLISKLLISRCTLVLSNPTGRICILDVTIKKRVVCLIGVYGPNVVSELSAFFGCVVTRVTSLRQVIFLCVIGTPSLVPI